MDLICRTCLAYDDDLEPLFSKKLVDTEYNEITTMLLLCTGLEITEDDKLYNTICSQCIESIIAAFKYRKKVWNSNTVILEATKVLDNETKCNIDFETAYAESKFELCDNEMHQSDSPHMDGEPNFIGLGLDETNNIDEFIAAVPVNHKSFRDMDRYIRVADESNNLKKFSCAICSQMYDLVGPLRKHLAINHNIRVLKAFRCKTCSKNFINEKYFQQHLKEAHQPVPINQNHVCDLCGKAFKFLSTLVQHINRHKGIKPFKCEICDFSTVGSHELKVHIRSHTGEKPYICHICGIGYKSSSHRGAHIKESHSDGQQYECSICGKTFKSRRVYMSHKLIHNPSRHIKCDVCGKEFNYRKNLKVHMRQHGEKTFKCTVCDKAFHQKQNCQSHMKKIHNDVKYKLI